MPSRRKPALQYVRKLSVSRLIVVAHKGLAAVDGEQLPGVPADGREHAHLAIEDIRHRIPLPVRLPPPAVAGVLDQVRIVHGARVELLWRLRKADLRRRALARQEPPHRAQHPLQVGAHVPARACANAVGARKHDPQDVEVRLDAAVRKLAVPIAAVPVPYAGDLAAVLPDLAVEAQHGRRVVVKVRPVPLPSVRPLEPVDLALLWLQRILKEVAVIAPARLVALVAQKPRKLAPQLVELVRCVVQHRVALRRPELPPLALGLERLHVRRRRQRRCRRWRWRWRRRRRRRRQRREGRCWWRRRWRPRENGRWRRRLERRRRRRRRRRQPRLHRGRQRRRQRQRWWRRQRRQRKRHRGREIRRGRRRR
mmetsp:Transcript_41811/g.122311  ORF Transcript_41811/g.122311 Transcript_41811/m.122311 type:complete len:367 (+) Transcript_41811:351-1451(+)